MIRRTRSPRLRSAAAGRPRGSAIVPPCRCAGACRCAGMVRALLLLQIESECEFTRDVM